MIPASARRTMDARMADAIAEHMVHGGPPPPCFLVSYATRARSFLTAAIDHPSPVEVRS